MGNFRRSTTKIYWMNTTIVFFDPIYIRLALYQTSWGRRLISWGRLLQIFWKRQELCQWIFALLILKDVSNLLVSADFCLQEDNSKKWAALKNQISPLLLTPVLIRLSYSGVIRVKLFVLKHWIFFEDISNFNKWKSLIIDKKFWVLRNAMLSKENGNFATKVISTENVEKIVEEVRRKNQTYFFFKVTRRLV